MEPRIEGFEILAPIGSGAMSAVWRARDLRDGRTVALKVLHPHIALKPSARDRFLQELQAYERLRHRNVISCLRSGRDGDAWFVALELLEAGDLRAILDDAGRFPPEIAAFAISEVLSGLAHAHRAGVFHRDIKPENVMLDADGTIKIADFGIAVTVDFARLTAAGELVGTPAYMAPEQVESGTADARSDLWSVGVLLHELTTGSNPFETGNFEATVARVKRRTPAPPGYRAPLVPEELDRLAERLLQRDPALRPQSAEEALGELEPLLLRARAWACRAALLAFVSDPAAQNQIWTAERVDARLSAARSLLRAREPRHAAAALEASIALELDPSAAEAEALVTALSTHVAAVGSPRPSGRIDELERQAEENPASVQALIDLVRLARAGGNSVQAVRAYRWGRRRSGGDRFAFSRLATALGFDLAAHVEGEAPDSLRSRLQGGDARSTSGSGDAGTLVSRLALGVLTALVVLLLWAWLQGGSGEQPVVAAPTPPVVEVAVDPFELMLDKADALRARGDLERAVSLYDHLLDAAEGGPHSAAALFGAGWAYEGLGRLAAAADHYQRLIDEHPDDERIYATRRRLARLLEIDGESEAALQLLRPLRELGDWEDRALVQLESARLLATLGRIDEAFALHEDLLAASAPAWLRARARLERGRVLAQRGSPDAWYWLTAALGDAASGSFVALKAQQLLDDLDAAAPDGDPAAPVGLPGG